MSSPRLRIITGKGGVGKTTLATAIALAEAARGKRVLLAEANGGDQIASMLGVEPTRGHLREVLPRLFLVDLVPQEALHEYVLLTLKLEMLYKAVFENRFVRPMVRLVPSLGELVMLGKLWFHEGETLEGRPRFDVLVLDAPATGHTVTLLRTPRGVAESVPAGPVKTNAEAMDALVRDHDRTVVHVVAVAEEMPINEALSLWQQLGALGLRVDTLLLNHTVAPLPPGSDHVVAAWRDQPSLEAAAHALHARETKRREGEQHVARFAEAVRTELVRLPRLMALEERDRLERLAAQLGPWVEAS